MLDHDTRKQFPRAHRPCLDDIDDEQLDGSIDGSGLVVDDAGFGAGGCTTFVDPGSDPDSAELDGSTGFPPS
jgi:hypothetical protein